MFRNFSIKHMLPILLGVIGITLVSGIVFSPYLPSNIDVEVGKPASKTIVSPRYIEFESEKDHLETEELRKRRVALVDRVYTVDPVVNKSVISDLVDEFTAFRKMKLTDGNLDFLNPAVRALSPAQLESIKSYENLEFDRVERATIEISERVLMEGVREMTPAELDARVKSRIKPYELTPDQEQIVVTLIVGTLRPNLVFNEALTRKAQEKELKTIKPVVTVIKEGEPIVYEGELVTPEHVLVLKQLGMYGQIPNVLKYLGLWILTGLLGLLVDRFVYHFNRRIHTQLKYFGMTYVIVVLVVALSRFLMEVELFSGLVNSYFLVPIPMAAMLLSLLVTTNISMLVCTVISILVATMMTGDFYIFAFLFLSACVSTFSIFKRVSRSELMLAGYIVGAFNILFVVTLGLIREIGDPLWFLSNGLVSFSTGVLSSMITLAIVPYMESMFKITTQQTLLELSNLNHPLLRRLMMTAPGTYQHSLMVANLAEAAAEAIHADGILCRVGAYYHDIGKMKRPLFFTENQFSGENPHATLTPRMSKMVIAAHVRDGIDLAGKYNLPYVLRDFIAQHHGTSLVSFFFSQAMQTEEMSNPDAERESFRYPGPKPQMKEVGIVMLADSVEAAVRSLEKPTPNKIENLVDKIFHDKIDDDQLDECPLSLREIDAIKETFLRVFKGIYHSRIDYQEELDNLLSQSKAKRGTA